MSAEWDRATVWPRAGWLPRAMLVAVCVLLPLVMGSLGGGANAAEPNERQSAEARIRDAAAQRGASVPEQVPALGESQIGFLDALRETRRRATARSDDGHFRILVRDAVRRHPDLQGAIALQVGAKGATDETRAGQLPQVVGQSDGGWRSYDPNRLFGVPERRYTSAGVSLSVRQLVYDFGATAAAVRSAEIREQVFAARAEARRAELALRAVQAAIELDSARLQAALAAENEAARITILNYVRERHALGGGSFSDVLRAQARVADARAAVIAAGTRVDSAIAGYREMFGNVAPDTAGPTGPVDAAGTGRIDELAPRFATVRAAAAGRESARSELQAVTLRALPQLSVEGALTRRDMIGDGWPANDRTALFNLRYEFYTGGAAQARAVQALSRAEQSESDYQAAVLAFERFAGQVLAEAAANDQFLAARIEAVELAAASLRAVREQFAFRRGTLLDLLNAQEILQAAGRELIDAYSQQVFGGYRVLYIASGLDVHFGLVD